MRNIDVKKKIGNFAEIAVIFFLCIVTIAMDFVTLSFVKHALRNRFLIKIVQQSCGAVAAILLMRRLGVKLLGKPQNLLYLIPCVIIAIDNFQWSSYFNGNMELVHKEGIDFLLFGLYCLAVGLFEECIFRGVIFSVLAGAFSQDKKGLWKTYVLSSVIFGAAHLFNGFSLGTLLQVGYTILTGGLFGFVLLKTKNIFCCGLIHGLYNFCGLLFDTEARLGLGNGVVFDFGTAITMLIVCIALGSLILYWIARYSEEERSILYKKLGIYPKEQEKS